MPVYHPAPLSDGATIGIISPSGPVRDRAQFQKGINYLKQRGYRIHLGEHALERTFHMSAPGKAKAEDLNAMFADPSVQAIFPSVGGHTANQVIEHLDFELIKENPKILIGFSDTSVVINAIYARTGLVSLHDSVDIMFGVGRFGDESLATRGDYTAEYLFRVLRSTDPLGRIEPLTEWRCLKKGTGTGHALGGNLSTIRALIGTNYEPNWFGAILFLEDRAEPHQWDQQLGHLRLAGVLSKLAALVVGKVENKPEQFYKENFEPLPDIVSRHCVGYDFPILYAADFGHDVENFPLLLGVQTRVDGGACSIEYLESMVRI